jgi:hypothetical protein
LDHGFGMLARELSHAFFQVFIWAMGELAPRRGPASCGSNYVQPSAAVWSSSDEWRLAEARPMLVCSLGSLKLSVRVPLSL